jgi:cellulose synthase operon protein C
MKVVRTAKLWFKAGGSDKVYEILIVDTQASKSAARFLINFRYGRRGGSLREGSKTSTPVTRENADKLFDSILVAKANEGYRRVDGPADLDPNLGAEFALNHEVRQRRDQDGRTEELLRRLDACLSDPWPEKDRDRLFWRIGQVRIASASSALLRMTERLGLETVSYSLVWALARCAGGAAADVLKRIAASSPNPAVCGLASMASVSALMGEARFDAAPSEPLPDDMARAVESADPDAIMVALAKIAAPAPTPNQGWKRMEIAAGNLEIAAGNKVPAHTPARTGPILVDLYHLAQQNAALHQALVTIVPRLPARPPYLYGLRKLFKYSELLDDALMFGATAHRFETCHPLYKDGQRSNWGKRKGQFYISEIGGWVTLDHLTPTADGKPGDVKTGLSQATQLYMKRRIWRTLRKRAELGQRSFVEMATAYLLAFADTDMAEEHRRFVWKRDELRSHQFKRHTHVYGPFSYAWTMGHLLYQHAPSVQLITSALTVVEVAVVDQKQRSEAFPQLWDEYPEFALRLAAESCCLNIATFGARVLRNNPKYMRGLAVSVLETLLASNHAVVAQLAFEEARNRLARGKSDVSLLAALLDSRLPEARKLAVERINSDPALPWSSARLGLSVITNASDEFVAVAAAGWCVERKLESEASIELAQTTIQWLLDQPDAPDQPMTARIQRLRRCMPLLWPAPTLPASIETIELLLSHPSTQVAAAGVDVLTLSAANVLALPDALWQRLLTSPAAEVQAAALGLLNRLSDEQLAERAFLVMSLVMAPSAEVRRAARPLAARLAARFDRFADDLFRRLIDAAFLSEPVEGFADDVVALVREALPRQMQTMDSGLLWRLLYAKAKGAQKLGAAALAVRDSSVFSVRQIARLGNHSHLVVRQWVMTAYSASPERFTAEAADSVLLVESEWSETHDFAMDYFRALPEEAWTADVLSVITDSVKPSVLELARDVLRRTLSPEDAPIQLARLLEHPAASMHMLATELLTTESVASEDAFAKLLSFARIVMLQIHKGRTAKERMAAFLRAEALANRERAERIAPLFVDLSLSAVERDRAQAILILRDIAETHPGLSSPVIRRPVRVA